jgi:hypothetical protein
MPNSDVKRKRHPEYRNVKYGELRWYRTRDMELTGGSGQFPDLGS